MALTIDEMFAKCSPEPNTGCWLWMGQTQGRYGCLRLKGSRKQVSAHRHMFFLKTGERPEVVMHRCDQPFCVNPDHLQAGTHALNVADRHAKGRDGRTQGRPGTARPTAKLTEAIIPEVRRFVAEGASHRAAGARFGVHHAVIGHIVRRTAWSHVP